jgi:hypothetical protein
MDYADMFPEIDVYRWTTADTDPSVYGPNGHAVLDLIVRARRVTWAEIERIGSFSATAMPIGKQAHGWRDTCAVLSGLLRR